MLPFTQTSDDELNDLLLGTDDNITDLYDNCSSLNFGPFRLTDSKKYFLTDESDPVVNFYKHLSMNNL